MFLWILGLLLLLLNIAVLQQQTSKYVSVTTSVFIPFRLADNSEIRDSCQLDKMTSLYRRFIAEFSHLTRLNQTSSIPPDVQQQQRQQQRPADVELQQQQQQQQQPADVELQQQQQQPIDVESPTEEPQQQIISPPSQQQQQQQQQQPSDQSASELELVKSRLRENNTLVFQLKEEKITLGTYSRTVVQSDVGGRSRTNSPETTICNRIRQYDSMTV